MKTVPVTIIGGGLAGCEAAWQILRKGIPVELYEMKPLLYSEAHRSPHLAELVCSNSFRSENPETAIGLLKEEMKLADSLVMSAAFASRIPAGKALAVDRLKFSLHVETSLLLHDDFHLYREEVTEIPEDRICIIATGPLTSEGLSKTISELTGQEYLYFYDAISPIIEADSISSDAIFQASRYTEGEGDYLNCPLSIEEYENFCNEIIGGREIPFRDFEDATFFEGCLPIEVMAKRGRETLRFGPMKPVGLIDPKTGQQPYAVIQLRRENKEASLYNMVGFQTKLAWPEQKRIFRMIQGLEKAEFARFGSIHRNTFINAPLLLRKSLQLKNKNNVLFAGQITGVEGYLESSAMGVWAGLSATKLISGETPFPPPVTTAFGALVRHITETCSKSFQPMNINFGLFPQLEGRIKKSERGLRYKARALDDFRAWMHSY
ncbi:MAG: methylenetetrahydrofolate--tRNA-(uracil(54)-C(5))-methyltransferase (FADH(2)-oxidizing) TrmFO [Syntrophales bacterium]|jgi:methylenetetrahydrofolate--tRNA-(uracil-5-)-methyltransferase|nr:methylenetetrahydrofolate--tRNA-(uracil(54)-C(5))-methyltransferase (FADH(2)-oxidizing) TrmFO [Syntrophales bacterium]MDY0045012.1 methylenetetrahydrofolate--tRNA-(uracil(54)-C(5))-methyltransferase (FADH(2)-oxidizing) TrmFO [Syntrophales bacterium]